MRKKLFIFLIAALCCNGLIAQEVDDDPIPPDRDYRMFIGPKLGAGVALGSHSDVQNLDFGAAFSYQVGAVYNAHFGRRFELSNGGTGWFGFQIEALYGKNNLKLGTEGFGFSCIEIPVLAQLYVTPTFAIEAGATAVKVLGGTPSQITFDGATYGVGELRGSDVRITAGLCYKNPMGFMIDARYNMGMSPIAGNFDTKVSSFMLSFAYLFNIVK